jgi:hypothetical protein
MGRKEGPAEATRDVDILADGSCSAGVMNSIGVDSAETARR